MHAVLTSVLYWKTAKVCSLSNAVSNRFSRQAIYDVDLCGFTALYNLNIEACSITSRTIQKIADTLHEGLVLSHLSIGIYQKKNKTYYSFIVIYLLKNLN